LDTNEENIISTLSQKEKKYPSTPGMTLKATTDRKEDLDDLVEFLKIGFNCELQSKKLYSEDQDKFFQYIAISKKEA
jgi:hypothetical protein